MLDDLLLLSRQFLQNYRRPYTRYFFKHQFLNARLEIITGARGIGKSTAITQYLLSQHSLNSNKILYIQTDHFLVRPYALYTIAEKFYQQGGEIICFDEIHKYPNWSMELKSIYDTFPELRILVSGSSALEIHKGSHDLSRRAIQQEMYGMSFREFLELSLNDEFPIFSWEEITADHSALALTITDKLKTHKEKVLPLFKTYLQYGYYPYAIELENKKAFFITLEQSIHTSIESDLPAIYPNLTGASIEKIKQLLAYISRAVPFTPDLKNLKSMIGVSDERTLKTYLTYLEDARIILQLRRPDRKLSALEKPEKIYLNNTCQFYALRDHHDVNIGTIREVFFASMMRAVKMSLSLPITGDFLVDDKYTVEVGGKNKDERQIKTSETAYLALDDIETGIGRRIPLWLFGCLY
jgi:predicted AAA+ superfamily ATPase